MFHNFFDRMFHIECVCVCVFLIFVRTNIYIYSQYSKIEEC